MPDLGSVIDAPEAVVDEVVDHTADVVTDEPVVDDAAVVATDAPAEDWRKVPANLREYFKTPEGKAAKDAWYERNAFKEVFNGGVAQAKEIHAFLEEHGGKDGVVQALGDLTGKAQEYDGLLQAVESGKLPDGVADSPNFPQLAQAALDTWSQKDPDGWASAMSGIMAATIAQNGIPAFLDKMDMMLKYNDTAGFGEALKQLQGWAASFGTKASAPRTQTQQPNKLDQRAQELDQREAGMFNNELSRDVDSFRNPLISKELESFAKRRPNDSEAKDLAVQTVRSQVIQRMAADKDFQSKLNALTSKRDREGALRLIKSRETAAITEIAPKVGRLIFGNPAAVAKVEEKPAVRTATQLKPQMKPTEKFDAIWQS